MASPSAAVVGARCSEGDTAAVGPEELAANTIAMMPNHRRRMLTISPESKAGQQIVSRKSWRRSKEQRHTLVA
jgi:hypothetical protein